MKTLPESIAAEIMDTIERERRINKDDLVLAAERAIQRHTAEFSKIHPVTVIVDPGLTTGPSTFEDWKRIENSTTGKDDKSSSTHIVRWKVRGGEIDCNYPSSLVHAIEIRKAVAKLSYIEWARVERVDGKQENNPADQRRALYGKSLIDTLTNQALRIKAAQASLQCNVHTHGKHIWKHRYDAHMDQSYGECRCGAVTKSA